MKTEIWVTFNYGAWVISFKKRFDLPFTPVLGIQIYDEVGEYENTISLENVDGFCSTTIQYLTKEKSFLVDVRNFWKHPVTANVIDTEIEIFTNTGWERVDDTNIDDLKNLMKR